MKRMKPEEAISEIGKTIFMADFHTHKISRARLALAFQNMKPFTTQFSAKNQSEEPGNSKRPELYLLTHIMLRFPKVEMADLKS